MADELTKTARHAARTFLVETLKLKDATPEEVDKLALLLLPLTDLSDYRIDHNMLDEPGIYLRNYNVCVAKFHENTGGVQADLRKAFNAARRLFEAAFPDAPRSRSDGRERVRSADADRGRVRASKGS